MRLCALLSWFDEEPSWLAGCVASLGKAEVDHLVAVDGAYMLYPNSLRRYRSSQEQVEAIVGSAYGIGLGLTLHTPTQPYAGNELEKRNHMFDLGRAVSPKPDWFLIIDGDEIIREARGVKAALGATRDDVAYYRLWEGETPNQVRAIYRNVPSLHIRVTHYGYSHGDRLLWDGNGVPAEDLTDNVALEHRVRGGVRNQRKWDYYRAREDMGIERIPS